jgi:DNA-binding response OmpR family regulator
MTSLFQEYVSLGSHTLYVLEHARMMYIDDGDCPIKLTPLEYTLFRALLAQPRMLVLNSELLQHCGIIEPVGHSRVVERHIDSVRRKLRESGVHGLSILRVVSYGYVLLPGGEVDMLE